MAGAVTYTIEKAGKSFSTNKLYIKMTGSWTTDSSGDVNGITTAFKVSGVPILIITDPDGTDIPTDNYDITLIDDDGYDVLQGKGVDRDSSLTEQVSYLGVVFNTNLTLVVDNAGNAKKGVITIYFI